ncbi:TetR/AcrR family transcriptional regulator [Mycolicibacterium phlei]|jgi:AcrR family transcriptional regulator|uniref:TetR/AcrR family transcriptional regulator n=1 Tax=Mycolicibacterium phlei TaxID=1771 RepID=UPI00025AEE30|nr:TetR/AcrR family transcriptional regulator [Mycolicibacterium phlei]EID14513.1 transcriptional regulator [Mycolicibacterium phlei RIVM601174]MBF4195655.1 transcriptional regulator [Mycolicibacterium phlei]
MSTSQADSARQEIRTAALHLFSTVGFHGTGIRRIAEEAGVSLATLYHYMKTKEDLLVEILMENILTLLREAEIALQGKVSGVDRLAALVEVHVRIHTEQRLQCIVSDTELRALAGERRASIVNYRDDYEALWRNAIDAAVQDGSAVVSDVAIATKSLLEMCTGVAHWYRPDGRLDLASLTDIYIELCLNALGVPKAKRKNL